MEINAAIVESISEWAEKIEDIIKKNLKMKHLKIELYTSAEEFLEAEKEYQIVFMDIYLKKMNGFEAIQRYKCKFPDSLVMIVTSSKKFYKEGYKIGAFRYIEMDNLEEELTEGLQALVKLKRYNTIDIDVSGKGKIRLMYYDIIYIETAGRKVMFHTTNENYIVERKISELEDRLKEEDFYRSDKSFLVNLYWADKMILEENGNVIKILLRNGEKIPLAVKKKKELVIKLNECRKKQRNRYM